MNEKLLRSIMAMKGDYDAICLVPILNVSVLTVRQKMKGITEWKQNEIASIAKHYNMDAETVAKVFELTK